MESVDLHVCLWTRRTLFFIVCYRWSVVGEKTVFTLAEGHADLQIPEYSTVKDDGWLI